MENKSPDECLDCRTCCTRLEKVGVAFGVNQVLKDINLHIHCGQLTAIIGPNGAGKTTLFRAILGEVPFTGEIHNDLSHAQKPHDLIIGYVPQRLEYDATSPVSVLDLFAAALSARPVWTGQSGATIRAARSALDMVEAGQLLRARLGTLSGGQLQRVLLALALTPVPDLLLLDEPVSGVDPSGIDLFYRMVSDLRRRHHLAILLVSHDCAVVARHADRMLFLNRSILSDGKPADVLGSDIVIKTFGRVIIPEAAACARSSQEDGL
ncbi:MAG: metal ABC transporter ATP-binding protein [Chitinivibrionales bacterium]|nr:metal ABC transporter ATP-binding protein [Chitinivibrionales bacterium]